MCCTAVSGRIHLRGLKSPIMGCVPIFTARKRSLGQGYIFRSVCQEFCLGGACSQEGVWSRGVPAPGGCLLWEGRGCPGGLLGGIGPRGVSSGALIPGGSARGMPLGDPPDGYCCGRYTSYWNAFLFVIAWTEEFTQWFMPNKSYVSYYEVGERVMFLQVCVILFTGGGVPDQVPPRTRYTPQTRYTPLGPGTPPRPGSPPPGPGRYGLRAGGTHPSGMQSFYTCLSFCSQ